MNALDPAGPVGNWALAVAGVGAVLFAAMLIAARRIETRRRGLIQADRTRTRDRALLQLSESLAAAGHPWASLREAAGCAALVTGADAAWTFVGVTDAPPAAALATGPVYPAWAGTVENRVMARSLARDAIRSGSSVSARQSAGAAWTAIALPGGGDRPAALVVRLPLAPGDLGASGLSDGDAGDEAPGRIGEDRITRVALLLRPIAEMTARSLDRARSQAEHDAERERLDAQQRESPDMDLLLDTAGLIEQTSIRVTEVLGYEAADLAGESLEKILAPGRGIEAEELLLETLLQGRLHRESLPLRRVDGQVIDSQADAIPVRGRAGLTSGFRFSLREGSGLGRVLEEQEQRIGKLEADLEAAREEVVWVEAGSQAREDVLQEELLEALRTRDESGARQGLVWARDRLDHDRSIARLREEIDALRAAASRAPQPGLALTGPAGAAIEPAPGTSAPGFAADESPARALVDRDSGRLLEAGEGLGRLLGLPAADLVGQRLSELHGIDRTPQLRREYEELLARGQGTLRHVEGAWRVDARPSETAGGTALEVTWECEEPLLARNGTFPLLRLIEGCVREARPEAIRRGIRLRFDAPDDPAMQGAAPGALAEAVGGLLRNAMTLTPDGGEIRIAAGTGDDGERRVVIRDTGIGIPTEDLQRWLAPGASGEAGPGPGPERDGAGIPRCREIVQAAGGRLAIESQVGLGTEFRLTVPRGPQ